MPGQPPYVKALKVHSYTVGYSLDHVLVVLECDWLLYFYDICVILLR